MIPEFFKHLKRPFSFAVVSDTHFVTRDFIGQAFDATRPLSTEGYVENVTYSLAPMMDALRGLKPDFIVLTGDVVEPPLDPEHHRENLKAALDFFATCDIPLIVARGNHDGTSSFDEVVGPRVAQFLGEMPKAHYFSFEVDGCQFIVLDTPFWNTEQCQWLDAVLAENAYAPSFLLGHHPIWPVARAFFYNRDFQTDMVNLLSRHAIDAYFCGHSHNQSIVLHRTPYLPVLQCMGALVGLSDAPPLPLHHVQALLPTPDDLMAIWPGYIENTAPGWFMGYVSQGQARVEWHHINRGAEAMVRWFRPGDIQTFWTMAPAPPAQLIEANLQRIRQGILRFCAWDSMGDARVFLNGNEIGLLPRADNFTPSRLSLPPNALACLQMENKVRIEPAEGSEMTLGNLVLEVVLPGGRYVRSQVFEEIYTWSNRWEGYEYETLQKMKPGRPLPTVLSFR